MYTLEDDQETSSRLRKRDFNEGAIHGVPVSSMVGVPLAGTPGIGAGTSGMGASTPTMDGAINGGVIQRSPMPLSPRQITSSFKRLTTPAQNASGRKAMALAALTIACIGVFFTALDQTVVVTALPKMILDLQLQVIQIDHAAWIISAYLLGFIIVMPLMGRVSDIFGRRRIFLLCLIIFGIGSLVCAITPLPGETGDTSILNLGFTSIDLTNLVASLHSDPTSFALNWLVAARFVQALGGGALVPIAMAITSDFYGESRRGLALGIVGAVTEVGGVLGPLYGAVVVQRWGWQWIFFLNIPLVLCLMIAAWRFIPKGTRLREGIDWTGTILLGIALACLSLGLAQQGTSLGPTTANSAAPQNNPTLLILALLFLIAFIIVERIPRWFVLQLSFVRRFLFLRLRVTKQQRWPVVDLSVFKRMQFSAAALVSLLIGAALIIALADIPLFVNTVLNDQNALDSGLALLRLTVMIPIGALLGGWLSSRISCRVTGVLGLIFTAVGFYLMSRWPIGVGQLQITISTMTAGLGFGLVIAPIGTTAINAVKANQAGMSSAVVTALRMLGMTLGLAALTSWALAYFKNLISAYSSLTEEANHLLDAEHTVYSAVFFTSMILCLVAILPAAFLWGRHVVASVPLGAINRVPTRGTPTMDGVIDQAPNDPDDVPTLVPDSLGAIDQVPTVPVPIPAPADDELEANSIFLDPALAGPPIVPPIVPTGGGGGGGNGRGGNRHNRQRRRLILALASFILALILVIAGVIAAFLWQSPDNNTAVQPSNTANPVVGNAPADTPTATPIAGPRMIQLALDKDAVTSLFISELGLKSGILTDLAATPTTADGLILSLNLHIDTNGLHRVLPIELDSVLVLDKQQNIQLHILHLKRDGVDAGATAATSMETALNQLLVGTLMPALHSQLQGVKLISVHTSTTISCGKGAEMVVLLIQAPPIQGIAAQPIPVPFCFKGSIDLNKLFPH